MGFLGGIANSVPPTAGTKPKSGGSGGGGGITPGDATSVQKHIELLKKQIQRNQTRLKMLKIELRAHENHLKSL